MLSVAVIAEPADLDLYVPVLQRLGNVVSCDRHQRVVGQARHITAVGADEVGVSVVEVVGLGLVGFKAPEAIAEFDPLDELGGFEVGEVSPDGALVPLVFVQCVADVCVAHGVLGLSQEVQDEDTCRCCAQACVTDRVFTGVDRVVVGRGWGSVRHGGIPERGCFEYRANG